MIYFYCPACKEELEADDNIRGTKMKCPACWKEIEVPHIGIKPPASKTKADKRPVTVRERPGSGAMIAIVVACGTLALLAGAGVWYAIRNRPKPPPVPCTACRGTGLSTCSSCGGSKTQACTNKCQGGKITNVHNELETCSACTGAGTIACQICGGIGGLSCGRCYGTKVEGAEMPPMYDRGKGPPRY